MKYDYDEELNFDADYVCNSGFIEYTCPNCGEMFDTKVFVNTPDYEVQCPSCAEFFTVKGEEDY